MGGEKARDRASVVMVKGSPPRGRGKGEGCPAERAEDRITPAWAGKRDGAAPTGSPPRDHPRVGGEKLMSAISCLLVAGSPPRGRGKGGGVYCCLTSLRITPAWAGKSRLRKMYRPAFTGSPPCGRGKGSFTMTSFQCFGITPAWAGKSRHSGKRWPRPWDHPRVGGEKSSLSSASLHGPGSPPHGRGKGCCPC